jgi:alpha-galactosidase
MRPHIGNQERVLKAALRCDREEVFDAFKNDPLVSGRCSDGALRLLADDMLKNTMDFLPEGWGLRRG